MSLLWLEGFESFGNTTGATATGIGSKYSSCIADSNYTVQPGRHSGQSCRFGSTGALITTPSLGTPNILIAGFGLMQDAFLNEQTIAVFYDGPTAQCTIRIDSTGKLKVYAGTAGGTLIGTTSTGLTGSVWTYVEIKVSFWIVTGTVDIHFNGSSVLSLTGVQTAITSSASATRLQLLGSLNTGDHTTYDDLYVCDSSGTRNNDFLGPRVIRMLAPTSDAGTNQWTPDSGTTHYNRVNQTPHDGDTTYLEDSTSGDKELFGHGACGMADVDGIQLSTVARMTDAPTMHLANTLHSGSTDSNDSQPTAVAGTDYQTFSRVSETDPNTSAAWTPANLNAATFGFKVS